MTLKDAAAAGIFRVRRAIWASPDAYLRQDIFADGTVGPWCHLYDRGTQQVIGADTPQDVLRWACSGDDWLAFAGVVDAEDTWEQVREPIRPVVTLGNAPQQPGEPDEHYERRMAPARTRGVKEAG